MASKRSIAWTASLGMFISALDLTVVNVALTSIAHSLKTDLSGVPRYRVLQPLDNRNFALVELEFDNPGQA